MLVSFVGGGMVADAGWEKGDNSTELLVMSTSIFDESRS